MSSPHRAVLALLLTSFFSVSVLAQDLAVAKHNDPPPAELADPIEVVLAAGGQRVTAGAKTLDFWWVKSLPLASGSSETGWSAVEEGTLVGAVKLSAAYPDIRGKTIRAGMYTLRYGLQPQNGDHLGVSPFREFLLLSPAAVDNSAAALDHDGTINISKQALGTSHPAAWSLDPPLASDAPLSLRTNEAGQKGLIFAVPVSRDGKDVGTLRFGLTLVGTIQS